MDVKLPDGTIIQNVPDGTTQAQLQQRLGKAGIKFDQPKAPAAKPGGGEDWGAKIGASLKDLFVGYPERESKAALGQLKQDVAPGAADQWGIGPGFDELLQAGKTGMDVAGYALAPEAGLARGVGERLTAPLGQDVKQAAGEALAQTAMIWTPFGPVKAKGPMAERAAARAGTEKPAEPPPAGPSGGAPAAAKAPLALPAPADMTPAIKKPTGEIVAGEKGKTHADIPGLAPEDEHGFVGADGKFKSRTEAGAVARAAGVDVPKDLHSEDLNAARNLPAKVGPAGGGGGGPVDKPPGGGDFHWPDREDAEDGKRPPEVTEEEVFKMGRNLDDVLYRVQTNNDADKIEAREYLENPAREHPDAEEARVWASPQFQERAYNEIEEVMADPKARLSMSDAVKNFLGGEFGRWYEEQKKLYKEIMGHPVGKAVLDSGESLPDAEGYIHRIPKGKGSMYDKGDPESYDRDVLTRGRTLSKQASALKGRKYFVVEGPDGKRAFAPREWVDKNEPYHGKTFTHNGKTYTAKYATTREVEAATATPKYGYTKPREYYKNALVNTVENVLRLRRVKRALAVTEALKRGLEERGLLYWGDNVSKAPKDFIPTKLPQLMGAVMHPAFAYALDDFYGSIGADAGDVEMIERLNRAIVKSIFFTPFPHLENVMSFWAVNRAQEWARPKGWASLMRTSIRAIADVAKSGPITKQLLREGSALQYPRIANQNFYKLMLERMGVEIERDPETWRGLAKNFGFRTPKDLVRMLYKTSQKFMWMGNDILMTQRVLELMEKGKTPQAAIKAAEQDIPNYRIPSQLWRRGGRSGRIFSQFLQSPNYIMFGRYKYDQGKFISALARDLLRGNAEERAQLEGEARKNLLASPDSEKMTPAERQAAIDKNVEMNTTGASRREALAKAIFLVGFGTSVAAIGDRLLQKITGNDQARFGRPGPWAIPDDIEQWATGAKDWVSALAGIVSPSPAIDITSEAFSGKDKFGRDIWKKGVSNLGHAVETGEWAAGQFAPLGEAMEMTKPGGTARVIGRNLPLRASIPPPGSAGKRKRFEREEIKRNIKSERKDEIENAIKRGLRDLGFQ